MEKGGRQGVHVCMVSRMNWKLDNGNSVVNIVADVNLTITSLPFIELNDGSQ